MSIDPRELYDELAGDYDLMFADWERSVRYQSKLLSGWLDGPDQRVLDIACGMGTQALGLALEGHRVVGRDLSTALLARAGEHAQRLGVELRTEVGDMRAPRAEDTGQYDAVVAFDNALPHLDSDDELLAALRGAHAALRPGGRFLASIRDYDRLLAEHPQFDPPRLHGEGESERIVFQLWRWRDARRYDFEVIILKRDAAAGWTPSVRTGSYRAILRSELSELAQTAGFTALEWLPPEQSRFYQPVLLARAAQ